MYDGLYTTPPTSNGVVLGSVVLPKVDEASGALEAAASDGADGSPQRAAWFANWAKQCLEAKNKGDGAGPGGDGDGSDDDQMSQLMMMKMFLMMQQQRGGGGPRP